MAKRPCLDCKTPTTGTRCTTCTRAKDKARGTSTDRGYGYQHKALSKSERANAVGKLCHLCDKPMDAGQALALDHNVERTAYRGVVHLACNATEAARRRGISPHA